MRQKLRLAALILCLALLLGACAGHQTDSGNGPGLEVVVEEYTEPESVQAAEPAPAGKAGGETAVGTETKPRATEAPDAAEIPAEGVKGECGSLSWELSAAGVLRISGSGKMSSYQFNRLSEIPWSAYKDLVVSLVVEDGVTNVGDYAFYGCGALESVTLPASVSGIGSCAFTLCKSLKEAEIPEGVKSIGSNAFYYCEALERVSIPASVTEIGESAFNECGSLREITVAEESKSYSSLDGVLFDKAQKKLLLHPRALDGAYTVPDGVREIGDFAFTLCEGLTETRIPESVKDIGMAAFSGCAALKDVYYAGSDEDWAAIAISIGNEELLGSTLHCGGQRLIVLTGGEDYSCQAAMTWEEPGWIVTDGDGNELEALHDLVEVSGEIVPYHPEYYRLFYQYTDEDGQVFESQRRIHVVPAPPRYGEFPEGKAICLSFDGGPGPYTDRLLDILAEYDAKASFFVTGSDPAYFDCITRAAGEGHAIGVLSYCADEKTIYQDLQSYYDDFAACEALIAEYTGSETLLFRFLGGSSNPVTSKTPGIISMLSVYMQEMGYSYFDWNVSGSDTKEPPLSAEQIYELVTNGCAQQDYAIVYLHDINENTVEAVADIIRWGQENGYAFLALDENLYGWHHQISN